MELHLGEVQPGFRACLHSQAPHHRDQETEGVCLRMEPCNREASTNKELGAGKLHAGVCTEGAG